METEQNIYLNEEVSVFFYLVYRCTRKINYHKHKHTVNAKNCEFILFVVVIVVLEEITRKEVCLISSYVIASHIFGRTEVIRTIPMTP